MCECTAAWRGVSRQVASLEAAGSLRLALVFFSQTSPAGCGRRPGTRPGPRTGKGPEVEVDTGFVDGPQASI